jgi:hypothetical protein
MSPLGALPKRGCKPRAAGSASGEEKHDEPSHHSIVLIAASLVALQKVSMRKLIATIAIEFNK